MGIDKCQLDGFAEVGKLDEDAINAAGISSKVLEAGITFHKKHPEVYKLFENFTFEIMGAGVRHIGPQAIIERIRYETKVNKDYKQAGEFKINNNYAAFYSRLFMRVHPHHKGFFRTRNKNK